MPESLRSAKSNNKKSLKRSKSAESSKSYGKKRSHSIASSAKSAYKELKAHGLAAIPTRYIVVLVAAIANTLSYTIRTNMSVTIVAMVNTTAVKDSNHNLNNNTDDPNDTCPKEDGDSQNTDNFGEFDWSSTMQGHILGAFYYGYIATNINGGQLADRFGVRLLCGIVTLSSGILTLLTPVISRWTPIALVLLRVLTGLAQGVLTPAIYALLAQWVPRDERGTVLALIQVGGNIGAVLTMPLSGFLCESGFLGGWPSVFYVLGTCGILAFFLWMYCIYDTPAQHPRILGKELLHIQSHVTVSIGKKENKSIPWISIFLSLPMWAIAMAKFCGAWGNLMLMAKLPTYLSSVLHMPIQLNGVISAVVYIALSISLTFFGFVSDRIGKKRIINETLSRKIFETIALGGPAICLSLVPLFGCNDIMVIVILVIALTIFGLNAGGDKPIVVDIAPDYSGTIYGITNAIASVPGIVAPIFVGMMLDNKIGSLSRWSIVFYSSSGIYIFGAIFFIIFGTAKAQRWGMTEARSRRQTRASSKASSVKSSRGTSRINTPAGDRKKKNDIIVNVINEESKDQVMDRQNDFVTFRIENERVNENVADDDDDDDDYEDDDDIDMMHFRERRYSIFPIP